MRVDLMGLTRWKGPGNEASLVHFVSMLMLIDSHLPALY